MLVLGLSGCRQERSAAAFCSTYWEQRQAYIDKYEQAASDMRAAGDQDSLGGLFFGVSMMAQSVGDTVVIFDKLDKVAPMEIEPDVAAVRDSLQSQMDMAAEMATNPLGALAQGLFTGLASGGSWQRVSDYTLAHCGDSPESGG
jgi:hypothetical protein